MCTWHLDFLPETTTVASESVSVNPGDFQRAGSSCFAVAPDHLLFLPSAFPGGIVEGNFCVILPASQVASGVLFVAPTSAIGDRVWWAQG